MQVHPLLLVPIEMLNTWYKAQGLEIAYTGNSLSWPTSIGLWLCSSLLRRGSLGGLLGRGRLLCSLSRSCLLHEERLVQWLFTVMLIFRAYLGGGLSGWLDFLLCRSSRFGLLLSKLHWAGRTWT